MLKMDIMNYQSKTKKELLHELKEFQQENNSLKSLFKEISGLKKTKMALIASEIYFKYFI